MNSDLNRRFYQRFSMNESASLLLKDGAEERILLKNISSSGASIVMDRFPYQSERVTLLINAPALLDKPVTRNAEMVWCKKISNKAWQLGLDFGVNRVVIPHSLPREEVKKEPSAKRAPVPLWVVVSSAIAVMLGMVLFLSKEKLRIYFSPQKSASLPARTPLQLFLPSRTLTLRGITFDPRGASFALINNKAVVEGEKIEGGIEVRKINKDSVEITIGGKNQLLQLNKTISVPQE